MRSARQDANAAVGRGAPKTRDVVVIGGGAAGLSGALMLGRSRRSVLVVDSGEPRNAPAAGVHGFLSRDGVSPAALLEAGRAEVQGYGVEVLDGRAASAASTDDGFVVALEGGRRVVARRLLVTTGLVDELPKIPGVRERWGRDVLHCPYCHGWEVQDRQIGVLNVGPFSAHVAMLFRQLSDDVILFKHTAPELPGDQAERLDALGIAVIEGEVSAVEARDDRMTGVRLSSGGFVPREALVVSGMLRARAGVLDALGVETADKEMGGHVIGTHVPAGASGATNVPGVWVAGNVADPLAQVVGAANAGAQAGAAINADLVAEDASRAVDALRARAGARAGAGA